MRGSGGTPSLSHRLSPLGISRGTRVAPVHGETTSHESREATMALKDLLVHVDNDPACAPRVDVAAALAARHEAHLTDSIPWDGPGCLATSRPSCREFLDEQRRSSKELARQAETRIPRARLAADGIRGEWRVDTGDIIGITKLHARYADLTIVGQGIDLKDAPYDLRFLPKSWPWVSDDPVLVVPRYGTFETVGERVLIAWNGSREATRAVHDARFRSIRRATNVTVLSIDPERDTSRSAAQRGHRAPPGAPWDRRGSHVDARTRHRGGDLLLSRAADLGADLHRHGRLRPLAPCARWCLAGRLDTSSST